jgi:hypothetical protein
MQGNHSKQNLFRRVGATMFVTGLLVACAGLSRESRADEKKPAGKDGPKTTYADHVLPIFREKCASCHNTDKKTAGLDLTT